MLQVVETRRSVRKYADKPVEDEKLRCLLESARLAPSGSNTQPWHFIIVKSEEARGRLAQVSHMQEWMLSAPVFIVCIADMSSRLKDKEGIFLDENSPDPELKMIIRDTSIAVENMVLEAENQGLGTCWVAWFVQEEIRPVLGIPSDKYVLAVVTLGYPAENPKPRPRKRLEDIVHYEKW
ncbi:MAG TPA: nitroreductase family protein [Clostridia bacterium]|nr:nitroreductase family protein [Clostridia bacterium]